MFSHIFHVFRWAWRRAVNKTPAKPLGRRDQGVRRVHSRDRVRQSRQRDDCYNIREINPLRSHSHASVMRLDWPVASGRDVRKTTRDVLTSNCRSAECRGTKNKCLPQELWTSSLSITGGNHHEDLDKAGSSRAGSRPRSDVVPPR